MGCQHNAIHLCFKGPLRKAHKFKFFVFHQASYQRFVNNKTTKNYNLVTEKVLMFVQLFTQFFRVQMKMFWDQNSDYYDCVCGKYFLFNFCHR